MAAAAQREALLAQLQQQGGDGGSVCDAPGLQGAGVQMAGARRPGARAGCSAASAAAAGDAPAARASRAAPAALTGAPAFAPACLPFPAASKAALLAEIEGYIRATQASGGTQVRRRGAGHGACSRPPAQAAGEQQQLQLLLRAGLLESTAHQGTHAASHTR